MLPCCLTDGPFCSGQGGGDAPRVDALLLLLPGSIGALEASQAFVFGAMGLNPAIGISASLLIRGRDIALGTIGLWWGSKKLALRQTRNQINGRSI